MSCIIEVQQECADAAHHLQGADCSCGDVIATRRLETADWLAFHACATAPDTAFRFGPGAQSSSLQLG